MNEWSDETRSYLAKLKQLHTATQGVDMQRFRDTVEIFRQYAGRYGFDTLLLVAQGFQESRLDQRARSRVGAVGLMQLMPQTGHALGVGDIHQAEPNVHGGAKYMAQLMDDNFKNVPFDEQNHTCLLSLLTTWGQAPSNGCGARRKQKSLIRMCGSTMSSGWQQRG